MQIDHGAVIKNEKLGQRVPWMGHVTYFFEFWHPSIFQERLKLETWNLVRILITNGIYEKNAKLGQRGYEKARDLLWNFGPLHISATFEARKFIFGMQIKHEGQ